MFSLIVTVGVGSMIIGFLSLTLSWCKNFTNKLMNVAALASNILLVLITLVLTLLWALVHIAAKEEGTAGAYSSDLWMLVPLFPFAFCISTLILVSRKIEKARA